MSKYLPDLNLQQVDKYQKLKVEYNEEKNKLKQYMKSIKVAKQRVSENYKLLQCFQNKMIKMNLKQNKTAKRHSQLDYFMLVGRKNLQQFRQNILVKLAQEYKRIYEEMNRRENDAKKLLKQYNRLLKKQNNCYLEQVKTYVRKLYVKTTLQIISFHLGCFSIQKAKLKQDSQATKNFLLSVAKYIESMQDKIRATKKIEDQLKHTCEEYFQQAKIKWEKESKQFIHALNQLRIDKKEIEQVEKQIQQSKILPKKSRKNKKQNKQNIQQPKSNRSLLRDSPLSGKGKKAIKQPILKIKDKDKDKGKGKSNGKNDHKNNKMKQSEIGNNKQDKYNKIKSTTKQQQPMPQRKNNYKIDWNNLGVKKDVNQQNNKNIKNSNKSMSNSNSGTSQIKKDKDKQNKQPFNGNNKQKLNQILKRGKNKKQGSQMNGDDDESDQKKEGEEDDDSDSSQHNRNNNNKDEDDNNEGKKKANQSQNKQKDDSEEGDRNDGDGDDQSSEDSNHQSETQTNNDHHKRR